MDKKYGKKYRGKTRVEDHEVQVDEVYAQNEQQAREHIDGRLLARGFFLIHGLFTLFGWVEEADDE